MTRQKQTSAAKHEVAELSGDAQLQASIKKLARLRSNLKALQVEISEKILNGMKDCPELSSEALSDVKDLNATITTQK